MRAAPRQAFMTLQAIAPLRSKAGRRDSVLRRSHVRMGTGRHPNSVVWMQTVDIMRFRERLQLESETKQRVTMAELIALCKER